MEHAVTVKDVLYVIGGLVGLFGVAGLCFGLLWLLNPFRSGH